MGLPLIAYYLKYEIIEIQALFFEAFVETTMFGLFKAKDPVVNLTPQEVAECLKTNEILLVDVREPSEFAAEHIKGAVNIPLSRLSAEALPEAKGRTLVMQCLAGGRSSQGVNTCRDLGLGVDHHMQGGLNAWKAAGLPTTR